MAIIELTALMETSEKTTEEKLRLLKKARLNLMEELHSKQQLVDQVDYLIYQLQTAKKSAKVRGGD